MFSHNRFYPLHFSLVLPLSGAILLLLSLSLRSEPAVGWTEQIVTTATRVETLADEHKGSVSILEAEELGTIGQVHIQEALLRIPGVALQRGNGQEYLPALRSPVLTGAGGCGGFLMTEDGIPLRAAGFCNVNELFEAHTELAERIEVLRGPGAAAHGSNALHGVVNVVLPDAAQQGGMLSAEAGPYEYGRLKMRVGTGGDESGLGVLMSLTTDGGYRDQSGFEQQKYGLRHRFQRGALQIDSAISFVELEQETAGFITGADSYQSATIARTNPTPEAYRNARSLRLWSRWQYDLSSNAQLLVTPYLRNTHMQFVQHFLPGDPLETNGQRGIGLQTAYHFSQGQNVQLFGGVDLEYTQGFLEQFQVAPTIGSAFLEATIPQGRQYDYTVDAKLGAAFIQANLQLTERWEMELGTRFEVMHYAYANNMLPGRTREDGSVCAFGGCRYSRPPSGDNQFDNWSPKFAAQYRWNKSNALYFRFARAFRAPQATELYRLQRDQVTAELRSEQISSVELGIKGGGPAFRYSLALFSMQKENVIFRDSDFFTVNGGETDHDGVELALHYRLSSDWDIQLSASYARHTYAADQMLSGVNINGNDIDTAPRSFGSARLAWEFTKSGRVELEWQRMGPYYLEPENQRRYEGHDLVNLRVVWEPIQGSRVFVRLMNLGDTPYAERADFTSFTAERYLPGRARSLYAGVEWRW